VVAEHHQGEDGEPGRDDRGDGGADLHPVDEGLAGGLQDLRAELAGQLPGDLDGAAERVAGDRRRPGRDAGRKVAGQLTAVDGESTEEGEEERTS
jgi:hypothetical protein